MISVYGITDRGILRRENQDAFCCETIREDQAWGVVCDGMGGARAGDIASRIGVEVFREHMIQYHETETQLTPFDALHSAVEEGNKAILYYANSNRECFGMGTTLVGAIAQGSKAYVINIGDSRAYHISSGKINRVTRDHSIVEALVERGNITAEQARQHPQKNLITRALGTSKTAQADDYELTMQYGDCLLLCSDGLINEMSDEEILQVINQRDSLEAACESLLDIVLDRGAPDNVTILLIHWEAKE
jgi:protein phosphatase